MYNTVYGQLSVSDVFSDEIDISVVSTFLESVVSSTVATTKVNRFLSVHQHNHKVVA